MFHAGVTVTLRVFSMGVLITFEDSFGDSKVIYLSLKKISSNGSVLMVSQNLGTKRLKKSWLVLQLLI